MPAAVRDVDRVLRRGGVEVLARDESLLRGLGVVVLEARDPFARRRFRGTLADRVLDGGDGAQVAIDETQVTAARIGRVAMPVDEAGNDRLAAEIDLLRARRGEVQDVDLRADGEDSSIRDCDGLRLRLCGVHREHVPVVQDQLRPLPQDCGQCGVGAHGKRGEAAGVLQQAPSGQAHSRALLQSRAWIQPAPGRPAAQCIPVWTGRRLENWGPCRIDLPRRTDAREGENGQGHGDEGGTMDNFGIDLDSIKTLLTTTVAAVAPKILAAFAFCLIGRWLTGRIPAGMRPAMTRRAVDPMLVKYLGSVVGVILNIALVIGILGYFGIETTSFAALLAGAGLAIGAAWSGMLGNFAAARSEPARHEPRRPGELPASVYAHESLLAGVLRHQRGDRPGLPRGGISGADSDPDRQADLIGKRPGHDLPVALPIGCAAARLPSAVHSVSGNRRTASRTRARSPRSSQSGARGPRRLLRTAGE